MGPVRTDDDKGDAPTLSLVLPVYNGERYLRQALDSIFAQQWTDFEVIAVDDCSTDATPVILADYAARYSHMRVLTNAVNSKLPASLNAGFRVARGSWFSWTSDDNILLPQTFARLFAAVRDHPDADVVYANYRMMDAAGAPRQLVEVRPSSELIFGNVVGCCFLYRRAVDAENGGYDPALFGVEDYDFWLRAAQHGCHFQPVDEELYLYRRHDRSLTDQRARKIHALVAERLLPEIARLPASARRAEAYVRLVCRDPFTLRWKWLGQAFADDPAVVLRATPQIVAWLRRCLSMRRPRAG